MMREQSDWERGGQDPWRTSTTERRPPFIRNIAENLQDEIDKAV